MRWVVLFPPLLGATLATACVTLVPPGKAPIAVAGETAIIVWDAKTHTEHFVRTATFTHTDGPMAFLVPTPSPPVLKALPDLDFAMDFSAVDTLNALVAPRYETKKRSVYRLSAGWDFWPQPRAEYASTHALATGAMMYLGDKDDVQVLGQSRVGGYDTVVLRASDTKALLQWLKTRGFASDNRLESWLRPYTEKGWAITAFRFTPKGKTYTSDPICMTFKADRPFYPYREPEAKNALNSRSLRLFLIAAERQAGHLSSGEWTTAPEFSRRIADLYLTPLEGALDLPDSTLGGAHLTSFLDKRQVRPDSDLFFDPSADQSNVEPTPIVRWQDDPVDVPKGLVTIVATLPFAGFVILKRRSR